jgi:hypothetical protein
MEDILETKLYQDQLENILIYLDISVGTNAQCRTVASNAQYLCNRYAMFMQSAIILHVQHLNGAQQKCYKCATCTIVYFTMIIFACTTNSWCTTYIHNIYFIIVAQFPCTFLLLCIVHLRFLLYVFLQIMSLQCTMIIKRS